jgi:hypothetical protein
MVRICEELPYLQDKNINKSMVHLGRVYEYLTIPHKKEIHTAPTGIHTAPTAIFQRGGFHPLVCCVIRKTPVFLGLNKYYIWCPISIIKVHIT